MTNYYKSLFFFYGEGRWCILIHPVTPSMSCVQKVWFVSKCIHHHCHHCHHCHHHHHHHHHHHLLSLQHGVRSGVKCYAFMTIDCFSLDCIGLYIVHCQLLAWGPLTMSCPFVLVVSRRLLQLDSSFDSNSR